MIPESGTAWPRGNMVSLVLLIIAISGITQIQMGEKADSFSHEHTEESLDHILKMSS